MPKAADIEHARRQMVYALSVADIELDHHGRGRCPFHDGSNPTALALHCDRDGVQRLRCFAECDGKARDAIDVYRWATGASFEEAVRALCDATGGSGEAIKRRPPKPPPPTKPSAHPPREIPPPGSLPPTWAKSGERHTARYVYKLENGHTDYVVDRYECEKDGRRMKETRPRIYQAGQWHGRGPTACSDGLHAIYGREWLARFPDAVAIFTEGEKAADRARELLPESFVVVAHSGGCKQARRVDLRPLTGRTVVIVPDNDSESAKWADQLFDLLEPITERVLIHGFIPDTAPESFDLADADAETARLFAVAVGVELRG